MIGGGIAGGENMWIKLQACRQKLSGRRLSQWGDSRLKYMGYTWSDGHGSGASSFLGRANCLEGEQMRGRDGQIALRAKASKVESGGGKRHMERGST